MLSAILGLAGAMIYGGSDFLGALASRRINPLRVTALSAFAGLLLLVALSPLLGAAWSPEAVLWGIVSGVAGAGAIALLYASLAIGPMSILSPLTALVSALVPMTVGLLSGERLPLIGYIALAIALVAVVLVGFVPEKGAARPSLRGLVMAVGSGALIGVFLVVIDLTPADSGLAPLLLSRAVNTVVTGAAVGVLALLALRRRRAADPALTAPAADGPATPTPADAAVPRWARNALALAIVCGVVDALANVLLLLALRAGELTVVSVLTALYPAGTVVLAAVLLKERVAPVQVVGLVLAFVAAAMLSLA
ncbi:DMT family transporter [Herbiconiux daphne]|uniref:DMT family transporter n=1 Tax=Herbiconiux daphne TaxID=2970914 RepID=A0ABT2H3S3_9MICO|nr:DMT family transporter [Herbiconiux daphne]MCS5734582.1 DMT family transporter [Herbiconiux daphne]